MNSAYESLTGALQLRLDRNISVVGIGDSCLDSWDYTPMFSASQEKHHMLYRAREELREVEVLDATLFGISL